MLTYILHNIYETVGMYISIKFQLNILINNHLDYFQVASTAHTAVVSNVSEVGAYSKQNLNNCQNL